MDERQGRFERLIEDHRGILYTICRSYCQDRNDREDLAQEIVIQLWRSFDRYDERFAFSTWMYRVALNVAISYHRKTRRHKRHVIFDDAVLETAVETEPARAGDVALLRAFIDELDSLPKALMLLYLDGYSHREIADTLGTSESNVGTKINRLKTALRRRFESTENIDP
ncbi:MAG TPA: RNA polymerase sigma factor [Candidatus Tumulicola sp.]|jgi:RNA polymerase sigma-70 factor (ECF subfamily)